MHLQAKKYAIKLILIAVIVASGIIPSTSAQQTPISQEEKTKLQQELADIENQIAAYQKELSQITGEKKALQNKINYLKKQQGSLNLQIRATALEIQDIEQEIGKTETAIDINTAKARDTKAKLAEFIALTYEQDNTPTLHIILSHDNLSDVLSELVFYSQVSERLNQLLKEAKALSEQLASDKLKLESQENETKGLLAIQRLQKEQLSGAESEHNELLAVTRGKESEYQAVLGVSQKQAAEIRGRLYQLLGVSTQITFGQAVEIAKYASGLTGVRASFLLAIQSNQRHIGKNVGTCNRGLIHVSG